MLALFQCAFGYRNHRVTISDIPVSVLAAMKGSSSGRAGDTATSIWKLLADTRNCGATDRRDKIFALKALVEDDQRELDQLIDYSRSTETVFNDVTMLLLPRVRLWLFLAVRHPHTLKMPSWMPDWSGKSTPNTTWILGGVPLAHAKDEFMISQLKCSQAECIGQHTILHVQGIQHSRITHLGVPFDFEGAEEFCYQALQRVIPKLEVPGLRLACGNSCHDILPPPIFEVLQYLAMEDRLGLFSRGGNSHLGRSKLGRSKWVLNNEEIQYITTELQNCRIFLTNDGTIGLAPTEACEGDMLCILRGSRSPSILRQRRENGWNLVSGDCFVPGELDNGTDDDDLFSTYVDAHRDKEHEFLIW